MIKKISVTIVFTLALLVTTKTSAQTETAQIKTKIYCTHCAQCETCGQRFDKELYQLKGLKNFIIEGNIIRVSYNPKKITLDKIRACIASCGYDADEVKATEAGLKSLDDCCRMQR